jgi:hypothetical protein
LINGRLPHAASAPSIIALALAVLSTGPIAFQVLNKQAAARCRCRLTATSFANSPACPVVPFNPLFEIYQFLTRDTISDGVYGTEERVASRDELLRLIAINYAKLTGEAYLKGSIEPGKLADFAVLSDHLLTVDANKIPTMKAMLTYVGGQEVWRDRRWRGP